MQWLIARVECCQALACGARLGLLLHRQRNLFGRQRQAAHRQTGQFLTQFRKAGGECNKLMFITTQLGEMGTPSGNFLAPLAKTLVPGKPLGERCQVSLQLFASA